VFGQSVTLTASVTTDSGTPTGAVELFDGLTSLGSATLSGGTAALSTSTLTGGSHALRADYAGASTFAPSVSPVVTQIVSLAATFITPANHATNVDLTQPFTWTSVSGAQAYYLYVGTSVGAKNLVNTGEIQQTSYGVPLTLASGAPLYARLWTKVGGTWRFVDATFSAPPIARFTYPATGTTIVDPTQPLTWTTVPTAQAYYLYVDSTLGPLTWLHFRVADVSIRS
jgi:Bacterial Ig-like domain (group 3)